MPRVNRSFILVAALASACGPAPTRSTAPTTPSASASASSSASLSSSSSSSSPAGGAPVAAGGAPGRNTPQCSYSVRRVSAWGRGGMRPQIAASADAFVVAWEETTDHRSVRVQTFATDAQPLGPSIEVADLQRAGASPRVAPGPEGDGFVVFWATASGDSSAVVMRKIDRTGKPKSDVIPVVVAPGVRPLDAQPTDKGYAVAWWNWSGTPHQLAVSYLDKDGRAVGRPWPITRAPSPDPTVDLASGATLGHKAQTVIAWDETVDDAEHVMVGDLGAQRLEGRIDLGPGETPRLGSGIIVWERPKETAIWWAPLSGGGAPQKLVDGHVPAAAAHGKATALCYLRDTDPSDEAHIDELSCGTLVDGKIADGTRIAVAPRGIFALATVSTGGHIGVAWQTQEDGDTGISFAALSCPGGAGAQAQK
jgi:hypothetical protein